MNIFNKIRDTFIGAQIGGSYAVNTILGRPHLLESDIDVYIPNVIGTRHMLTDLIVDGIFQGCAEEICLPQENQYRMPSIRRRILVRDLNSEETYDFIAVEGLDKDYLLNNQASAVTECYLELTFSEKGYRTVASPAFIDAHAGKKLRINTNEKVCTWEHQLKLQERFPEYELTKKSLA